MDILDILERFGWMGVALLWVLPRVWSFFVDRLYPQRVKEREKVIADREEGVRAEREARATLIKAQIERDNRESGVRLELEKRQVAAMEHMTAAINQMALAISSNRERIDSVFAALGQHINFTFGAHVELKDRMDDLQELIIYKDKVATLEKELKDTQEKIKPVHSTTDK